MKLVTFRRPDESIGWGIVKQDGVIDAHRRMGDALPTLRSVLDAGPSDKLQALSGQGPDLALAELQILPPLINPPKLIMIGLNYRAHQRELGLPEPRNPVVIARFANSQVGHGQPLIRPRVSDQFDYEGELAVVIGKRVRAIAPEDALSAVAGYACYMDGTVRDFQKHSTQVLPAKSFPGTGAFGPWIVTADEVPDPSNLQLVTRVNGEAVQTTSTDDMIWSVPQLVSYLSVFLELEPGDVIATGTTSGVGSMRQPPRWLKPGDSVEVEISSIGKLTNPVLAEA
ncbi:fumarylacetoacetate hydrolase family protein [Paraburkholderia graminis]|uniref:fumarylacetoacetate hydrolase family protein n=1 Tax=Paraburkholderia graminis TaxID=60548 RepID=UPI0038BDA23F